MSVSIQVNVTGDNIGERINQIGGNLGNLQPAMAEIGYKVEQLVLLGFIQSQNPYGQTWAAIRPRKDGSSIPLRDTGRLMNSMTHNADSHSVRIGTNVVYGERHQLGRGVKQRKVLPDVGLPPSWGDEVMDTLNGYLARVINGN